MDSVQSMAGSSSSTGPSFERTSHFNSQTDIEMESAKARHWSQLDYSTNDSEWSVETNSKYFDVLKEDPQWGRFFTDFETLEVGDKISEGAQADIYEARMTRDGPFALVVKVMKGDAPLKAFQVQWPIGMLSARSKYKHLFDLPLITILGGTMLRDQRLKGRFAFVMYRRWGDWRLLIDRRMKQQRSTFGPFSIDKVIHLMLSIAEDMDTLHNKHDIIHRDLKASNVLVWGEFGEDLSLVSTSNRVERIRSLVADFECSVGVLGTWFWMAPEILRQVLEGVPESGVQCTRESDVYSYGVTCYEIVTGCFPYDGLGVRDTTSQILKGRCLELPHELPEFLRHIIISCWHSDPLERPTFSAICMALKLMSGANNVNVVMDTTFEGAARSIVKVEQWNNPQPLTLLEVMEKLMDIKLLVLKASTLASTEMITQYFEVTYCNARKVVKNKSIASIPKSLSLPLKMKCISENLGTSIANYNIAQMYVIEVVATQEAGLLGILSKVLVATNFRVHCAGCWTREGQLECVMYVEGARMDTLLWELLHDMEYPRMYRGLFKMIVHKVAVEEFSHLSERLHNLKSMDLTLPPPSSNICVHFSLSKVGQEYERGIRSVKVVMCLEERWRLVNVSHTLEHMGYKIIGASLNRSGRIMFLINFLIGRANKSQHIDVGTFGEDESVKLFRILDIANERGCPKVNGQLVIFEPWESFDDLMHDDLMGIFRKNGLVVTGGQFYVDKGSWILELHFGT